MGVYLDTYPGALEPRRTPFDEPGEPRQPVVFIYMTNRYEGRWSYLMPPGFEREHNPMNYIGTGYTQLWIMQKLRAIHPDPTRRRRLRRAHVEAQPPFEDDVMRDDFAALFHVLREPGPNIHAHNDHVGGRRRLDDAIELATLHADWQRCRTVVARLVHDWSWH